MPHQLICLLPTVQHMDKVSGRRSVLVNENDIARQQGHSQRERTVRRDPHVAHLVDSMMCLIVVRQEETFQTVTSRTLHSRLLTDAAASQVGHDFVNT